MEDVTDAIRTAYCALSGDPGKPGFSKVCCSGASFAEWRWHMQYRPPAHAPRRMTQNDFLGVVQHHPLPQHLETSTLFSTISNLLF